ncbi:MAG: UDP-N-acetylglucosamine 2-epimerase (non-hydrolyzing) [Bacteroidales bacterium]|nr:UDP-N-acetylglucosamine 2-epimerase (non-hydrolyzing) [Bacteroidales bacterium]
MKIISVVGARPNFMKIAPFIRSIEEYNKSANDKITHILVHTGQHYDDRMSKLFFEELNIPEADINLGIGSGSHSEQVGYTMIEFEKVMLLEKPDWVVVVGDVNATLACSVAAKKLNIKCCHIEAGLRSGDMTMPEEINRLVTDRLCDLLLTPDKLSGQNLKAEGVSDKKIGFVGNIMIDTLDANYNKAAKLTFSQIIENNALHPNHIQIESEKYAVMTLHRPSNVDNKDILEPMLNFLIDEVGAEMPLIWPIHPRTAKQLEVFGLWEKVKNAKSLVLLHPLGYFEMLRLNMNAKIMLTDSGGLQEECTVLGTPCLTMRWNTERPVTLKEHGGVSVLVGNNINRLKEEFIVAMKLNRFPVRPELWDGQTADRCLKAILGYKE